MKLHLLDGLPYTSVEITFRGQTITIERVIVDTGSAGSVFSADLAARIRLFAEPLDSLRRIRGVGGSEFVFTKRVDRLSAGELHVEDFEIEVGAMSYGFDLDGILGMDFLTQARAVIDLHRLEISQSS